MAKGNPLANLNLGKKPPYKIDKPLTCKTCGATFTIRERGGDVRKTRYCPKCARPGNPTKKTPEVIAKLEEAFKSDFTLGEACAYAEIAEDTFHGWVSKDPEFKGKMDRAKLFLFTIAKKNIRNSVIEENNVEDSWKLLKSRQREIYTERIEQANTFPEGIPLTPIEELSTDDDFKAFLEEKARKELENGASKESR